MAAKRRRGRRGAPHTRRKTHAALVGKLKVTKPGVAEVATGEGTFPVAKGGLKEAMNGDTVGVTIGHGPRGVKLARIQHVVERAVTTFIGTYETLDPLGVVVPLDERIRRDFFVIPDDKSARELHVHDGDLVVARILEYPTRTAAGVVTVDRRIGSAEEVDVAMEAIIASHDLPLEFPEAVEREADSIHPDVAQAAADPRRRDRREVPLITIDPVGAKDFDDAVWCGSREGGGYRLMVAIADVTHYVPLESSIDLEARKRTTSTYLADRVIPMLPEVLSNDLCSLRPGEDRCAMVLSAELARDGSVISAEPERALIRSHGRLTYDEVDSHLDGVAPAVALEDKLQDAREVMESLKLLDEAATKRRALREERGAIDFDTEETKVVLDGEGHPVGVVERHRTRATTLVEEAMLLANEAVAKILAIRDIEAAYRVHESPDQENLEDLVPVLKEFDLLAKEKTAAFIAGDPYAIEGVLKRAHGGPAEVLVSTLLLRAMKRAVYKPKDEGHYALGAKYYCHFTSPIRRYPDVIVHRKLKALLDKKLDAAPMRKLDRILAQLCRDCSDGERNAASAESDSQHVKMAELYGGRLGTVESGTVVGCERFGLFVRLDDTGAQGLLPVRALGSEWFDYDEKRLTLTGEATGTIWRLGDRLDVRIQSVDVPKGRIDFSLPEAD